MNRYDVESFASSWGHQSETSLSIARTLTGIADICMIEDRGKLLPASSHTASLGLGHSGPSPCL